MSVQAQIDDGMQYCADCDQFGFLTFCGRCGRRYHGHGLERRKCANCSLEVAEHEFCPRCGEQLASEYLRRWERGEVNLLSEGQRAKAILEQMMKASPRLAVHLYPTHPQMHPAGTPADLVAAINRGMGNWVR